MQAAHPLIFTAITVRFGVSRVLSTWSIHSYRYICMGCLPLFYYISTHILHLQYLGYILYLLLRYIPISRIQLYISYILYSFFIFISFYILYLVVYVFYSPAHPFRLCVLRIQRTVYPLYPVYMSIFRPFILCVYYILCIYLLLYYCILYFTSPLRPSAQYLVVLSIYSAYLLQYLVLTPQPLSSPTISCVLQAMQTQHIASTARARDLLSLVRCVAYRYKHAGKRTKRERAHFSLVCAVFYAQHSVHASTMHS